MAGTVEDNLRCPACLDIFQDPVILLCSHSFCYVFVRQWWEQKGDQSCPVCRKRCQSTDPFSNLALRKVCKAFTQDSVELNDICSSHEEELNLFCEDHQEVVCIICRDEEIHAGHKFRALDEAARESRVSFLNRVSFLHNIVGSRKNNRDERIQHSEVIKLQREQIESKIKKTFEEFHRFLQVEESARLAAVRKDEEADNQRIKKDTEILDRDIATLSDVIKSAEELLTISGHVSFMKNFKTAMSRIQEVNWHSLCIFNSPLSQIDHVGNLKFHVWERMKETVSYSPVLLNPNTACSEMSLSEDLTSVTLLGKCPTSFDLEEWPMPKYVHGYVWGFPSDVGWRTWDVEVGDNNAWHVGVEYQDDDDQDHELRISFYDGKYICSSYLKKIHDPPMKLQRIRVHVDPAKRLLSFSDSLTKVELYSTYSKGHNYWKDYDESGLLLPIFYTGHPKMPLQIIPLRPRVELVSFDGKVVSSKPTKKKKKKKKKTRADI
ncbi:zinc-binding protein A33-like [Festucalex cinctus]